MANCIRPVSFANSVGEASRTCKNSKMFVCDRCNSTLSRKDVLLRHKVRCSKCLKCNPVQEFQNPEALKKHQDEMHQVPRREFVCARCDASFSRAYGLKRHQESCCVCKKCFPEQTFQSKDEFQSHVEEWHPRRTSKKRRIDAKEPR